MANKDKQEVFDPLYSPQSSGGNDGLKKFTDLLLENMKGKIVEVYIGDQVETTNYDDYSTPQNATIFGRLIDVLDRFLIFDCFYVDNKGNVQCDNRVLINSFQIRAMTEINGKGSLDDIFLSAKSVKQVKKYLHLKGNK